MLSDNYFLNEDNVWSRERPKKFSYSDGDQVEKRLLDELRLVNDVSSASDELQKLIKDWPSEYHYSPLRGNLFAPFNFETIGSVLEIGSGCGAITRVLGEQQVPVLALEGSCRRAAITRERCRDLDNVTVCCDTFENFSIQKKFDCITLIGVLEYSQAFMDGENPVKAMLHRVYDLLEDNGVLVVGIENQLGLKYFNGCSEDHSGSAFTGINDDYGDKQFCTLGRVELKSNLQSVGFSNMEYIYPFPDYKLPRVLVREEALSTRELNIGQIVGSYLSRDYTGQKNRLFHESKVWPLLERNDLLRDLSNSFLVFAFKGESGINRICNDWLCQTYSCPRKKSYLSFNVFTKVADSIAVEKKKIYPDEQEKKPVGEFSTVEHVVGQEQFVPGDSYTSSLRQYFYSGDILEAYSDYLAPWIEYIIKNSSLKRFENGEESYFISGDFFDCLPANLILNNSPEGFGLIDQEWRHESELEAGFIVFRGMYRDLTNHLSELEETPLFSDRSFFDVMAHVFEKHGFFLTREVLKKYIELEVDIQLNLIVYNVSFQELTDYLENTILLKRFQKNTVGHILALQDAVEVANHQDKIQDEVIFLRKELKAVKKTWSWKIGRFITGLFHFSFRKS